MMRRRGLPSFCHGVASTSTVQQLHGKEQPARVGGADAASSSFLAVPPSVVGSCVAETEVSGTGTGGGAGDGGGGPAVTLEEMILQLDLEEEAARKARRAAGYGGEEDDGWCPRRMSCVDGGGAGPADHVLRSARDALSQYPRFSVDGRDAMYRASFSGFYEGMGRDAAAAAAGTYSRPRASACGAGCGALVCSAGGYEMDLERTLRMPATVAGESVVWCKPGVVAKLMGLEAVPVPIRGGLRRRKASGHPAATCGGGGGVRKQRLRRTGQEELALNKEKLFMALHGYDVAGAGARHAGALRSGVGPDVSEMGNDGHGWEFRLRC
ncbi:uncharacterized protein LOC120672213 [Panicum virgatum]|uniref:DUF3741 domain-containing protein n=1 Tax=Panicum virgatum TaxID=38727 RepID=A0A8T0RN97_PANVG|nr:uncharacterized protein LOC120672213 [Panicum virgatum]KAG2587812.1 hypothetical protein PVAP13_5NG168600 [Panicum virgatum]